MRPKSSNLHGLPRNLDWFGAHASLKRMSTILERRDGINAFTSHVLPKAESLGAHSSETSMKDLPLSGKSIAIKDNICTSGLSTTCASQFLQDFHPPYDATVVSLLHKAGGHVNGKTNCDEFGMGSYNVHSLFGPVVNPFPRPDIFASTGTEGPPRSAGGSSGGSAAAVASSMCYAALGTDTGGSIRLPASYCGVAGFKPSYGLISRWGVISYADSLDTVGILAKSSSRIRDVFNVLNQFDAKDPTSIGVHFRDSANLIVRRLVVQMNGTRQDKPLLGLRIGVPKEYFPREMDDALRAQFARSLRSLRELGAEVIPVSLPSTKYALSSYYIIASAEASSNLARFTGVHYGEHSRLDGSEESPDTANLYARSRSLGLGKEVSKRILLGTYSLTADAFDNYYLQAQRIRKLIRRDFDGIFSCPNSLASKKVTARPSSTVDILIHPTAINSAPSLISVQTNPSTDTANEYMQDILTTPASLAGIPCLSIPVSQAADGWPVGLSIVGQWGADDLVLQIGEVIEQAHNV